MKLFGRYIYTQIGALLINCILFMIMQGFLATGETIEVASQRSDIPIALANTERVTDPLDTKPEPPQESNAEPQPTPVRPQQTLAMNLDVKGLDTYALPATTSTPVLELAPLEPLEMQPLEAQPLETQPAPAAPASPANMDGGYDKDYIALVKVPPRYPRRQLRNGVEGYVVISFTITAQGTVADPKVIDAKPKRVFNQAGLEAVSRFKYRPRTVNGQPVASHNVKTRITFKMRR